MWAISILINYLFLKTACLCIVFYLAYKNIKTINYWKKRGILYFPATPLFSKYIFNSFLIQHSLLKRVYNHGRDDVCCGFFQFRKPVLLIRTPHVINMILNQDFKYFQNKRHAEYSDGKQDPLSQHLLALNGVKWKYLRGKLTPTFTSERLRNMFPLLESCVNNFIKEIRKSNGRPIDMKELCGKLSIDAIASCAFGLELNCLKNKNHQFIEMGKAAFKAGDWQMFKAHLRILYPRLFKKLKLRAYGKEVSEFFCTLVADTIDLRRKIGDNRADFIYLLMKMLEEDEAIVSDAKSNSKIKFTDELVAAQAFSFYIGGYETTSVTMSCIFYELARNNKVRVKVRDEVDSILGKSSEISYDDLKGLEYLDMVIKEVLRLHPPAFYIQRISSEDFNIPGTDILIEKGMEVFIPILEIHRDEACFANATEFNPERFSRDNRHNIAKGSYLPFGDGPRKCIGMRFSLVELKLAVAKTLKEFDFQLDSNSPDQLELEDYSRIYKIRNKILIKFHKRVQN